VVAKESADYFGMKTKPGLKAVNPKKLLSDRYENRTQRRQDVEDYVDGQVNGQVDDADMRSDHSLEARSVCAELDYAKKDAATHIVKNEANSRKNKLRDRILKNLEGVRAGTSSIVKSQIGSVRSSHIS